MRLTLVALAALTACSGSGPDANAADRATSAATTASANLAAPAVAVGSDTPRPGELKTFGDWTVGCDNGRACQAVALVPGSDDRDRYLLLVVTRDGAGPAPARLIVPVEGAATGRLLLMVDGTTAAAFPRGAGADTVTLPLDRALASRLADGAMVALGDGRNPPTASASLKGLAAALLYIDDRQQRVGTVGALRRPGPRPDAGIPAPILPVVTSPPPGRAAPRTMTVAAATQAIGPDAATCDYANSPVTPRAYRLDARHSLVLVDHPCGNGAYNLFTSVYVVDEAGRAGPAKFDAPVGMGDASDHELTTGDWDAKARRLTSFARGRGIGDCGTQQQFAWDGTTFRLVEQSEMGECRQSLDYITTWRATVREGR